MSDMTLVEFLRARLDEDEKAARAATGQRWLAAESAPDEDDSSWVSISLEESGDDVAESRGDHGREYAAHIVRYDPARVLAEVAAKRRIVELHGDQHECVGSLDDALAYNPYIGCTTLRVLALPYAEHEAYRSEWAP